MKRPVWSNNNDTLFFINDKNQIISITENQIGIVCNNAQEFALSMSGKNILYKNNSDLNLLHLESDTEIEKIHNTKSNIFCFSKEDECYFVNCVEDNLNRIYAINQKTHKNILLFETNRTIRFIFPA